MTINESLVAAKSAVEKLNKSLAKNSLDDLVKARTRRSLLLCDCSDSMSGRIRSGDRRIDALRKVVNTLRETHPVPVAAFGVRCPGQVEVVDTIPEPQGSTPIDLAIDFGKDQGATHLLLVTDGEPNNAEAAFESAAKFGGVIDVFYIGDANGEGARFCETLAKMTGGTYTLATIELNTPKVLAGKIMLALGDGSEAI